MTALAFIPARAGSESIPYKNRFNLGGHPLIEWCMRAVVWNKPESLIDDIICSTDDDLTADIADRYGIRVVERPPHMCDGETYPIHEIVIEYLNTLSEDPDIVVLIQPTSPFVTVEQIELAVRRLGPDTRWDSFQTIADIPHNFHAWNQRSWNEETGQVEWCFPDLRARGFNKALKPKNWKFGNLVAAKTAALRTDGFFASPSLGHPVSWIEAMDLDKLEDFQLAESLIEQGLIKWGE